MTTARTTQYSLAILVFGCGCHAAPPTFATPIGAALDVYWSWRQDTAPPTLALNVPPTTPLDTTGLREDGTQWRRTIVLFRDTSWAAQAVITEDSLRTLKVVYDVRRLSHDEWWERLAPDTITFPGSDTEPDVRTTVTGDVYRVRGQSCRGWPCNGYALIEVRPQSGRYVGWRVLTSVVQ
jgi:hypothetical protein